MNSDSRCSNSSFLENRLDFNEKYSTNDFHVWLQSHLAKIDFRNVLDIGCGTGKQTFWFLDHLKENGAVCALDVSEECIKQLKAALRGNENAQVAVGSMDELRDVIDEEFSVKKFDLAHSAFSLYYAKDPISTLRDILSSLTDNGTLVISGPHLVNTLLSFLSRYQDIPRYSRDCLEFIDDVALSFCQRHFKDVEADVFVNNMFVTNAEDFAAYYRSSTFFDKKAEIAVLREVNERIAKTGHFHIQKNSKIVIAKNKLLPKCFYE